MALNPRSRLARSRLLVLLGLLRPPLLFRRRLRSNGLMYEGKAPPDGGETPAPVDPAEPAGLTNATGPAGEALPWAVPGIATPVLVAWGGLLLAVVELDGRSLSSS